MSVKSKSGTGSQAEGSNISETTNGEDKGQNRLVIDWLGQNDPNRTFLIAEGRNWTYGETLDEIRRRRRTTPMLLAPALSPEAVFDLLAGIAGGGAVVREGASSSTVPDPQGAALVVYTSGSSGPAKGVRLTRENLEAASRASVEHLGHGTEDTWLLAMPLAHVGGLSILVRSGYAGGSVRMLPRFDPGRVAETIRAGVTMVSVVPTMLRRLLDVDPGPYTGLRAVLVGGGPIPPGLLEEAVAAGLPALPTYGMTETFGQVATLRPGAPLGRHVHPLPGVEIRITDDGRIAVRGAQVSPGYLGEPDRASEWLVTSDLGLIDGDGALRVLGRSDDIIITGGENVDPVRVEAVIAAHPGVTDVVVVGVADDEWGMTVACAFVGEASPEDLAGWAGERLSGPLKPKLWKRVESIPRSAIDKPDRIAVTALF